LDTKSGHPFWPIHNGLIGELPPLAADRSCDVVVIGAGITGSLVASALVDAGLDVVVLDRRDAGWGSTAASTALLQYEIDTELSELTDLYGEFAAAEAYRACNEAIDGFADEVERLGQDVGFTRNGSLYYASHRRHARRMPAEFALRQRAGLPVELLDEGEVHERFGIVAPAALWTPHAARVDPYRFTRCLLAALRTRGAGVFDRTEVTGWTATDDARLEVATDRGVRVRCRHLVIAAGYESQRWLPRRVAHNHSSYALVTEPLDTLPFDLEHQVIWESARPYLYMRATEDRRLLIGGEDDKLDIAVKRDAALPGKARKLMKRLHKLAPDRTFEIGFSWAGTFAETTDGLPYIGTPADGDPRVRFAMAYGGNGITYSVIAAGLIRDSVLGRHNPRAALFGFARIGR
jgi:glycine/D-amino acid oxidase-like deaminating enzyme